MASRNLGTLTVDLVAKIGGFTQGMTKAEREADKTSRNLKRKLNQTTKEVGDAWSGIGKVLAASFAGLSVATVTSKMMSIAKETANAAQEVKNFAALANTSTQDFQRLAHGAGTVGISAEKLADILKDVQDKAGDFAQTGGGGMADFFENIAPRVGVTVEQFRRLSGPEALQLYVSSLEKANLSQQDLTFYMEAIASDSTALLPLLQNNGKAWRELGDEAERYGAILSDEAIKAAEAYREESRKLEASMAGVRVEIAEELLPVLTEMNRNLADPNIQGGISKTIELLAQMAAGVVDLGNELFLGMQYADGFWDALFKYGTANPFKSPQEHLDGLRKDLKKAQDDLNRFSFLKTDKQKQNDANKVRSLEQQIGYWTAIQKREDGKTMAALEALGREGLDPYPANSPLRPLSPVKPPKGGTKGKSQAEKDMEAAERFLQSLRDQVFKTQERTAWEQLSYDIQSKGLKLSEKQLSTAQGLATAIDMAKEAEKGRLAEIDKQNTLFSLQERLLNAQQQHQLEMMTFGMGDQAAQELRERMALMQQQQAELRQMQHDHAQELRAVEDEAQRDHLQAMFEERYRLTQEALAEELRLFDQAAKDKQAREKDWLAGAKAGMDTYVRDAGNGYEATKRLAQSTFKGAEDAAVQFAMTGKASASDLFKTIIEGLIRIQIQEAMTQMFGGGGNGGLLGSLIGAGIGWLTGGASVAGANPGQYSLTSGAGGSGLGLKLPGRANGGPVAAGGLYEVNEHGIPELLNIGGKQLLMMAGQSGFVTPLSNGASSFAASGAGGFTAPSVAAAPAGDITIEVNIDATGNAQTKAQGSGNTDALKQLGNLVGIAVREQIAKEKRPGGLLYSSGR